MEPSRDTEDRFEASARNQGDDRRENDTANRAPSREASNGQFSECVASFGHPQINLE